MAKPFVDSMTDAETQEAVFLYDQYLKARRLGSIKELAGRHGIRPLTMYRRIKRYKEGKDVPRIRSQRT